MLAANANANASHPCGKRLHLLSDRKENPPINRSKNTFLYPMSFIVLSIRWTQLEKEEKGGRWREEGEDGEEC